MISGWADWFKGTQYSQSSYANPIDSVHIYGQHDE